MATSFWSYINQCRTTSLTHSLTHSAQLTPTPTPTQLTQLIRCHSHSAHSQSAHSLTVSSQSLTVTHSHSRNVIPIVHGTEYCTWYSYNVGIFVIGIDFSAFRKTNERTNSEALWTKLASVHNDSEAKQRANARLHSQSQSTHSQSLTDSQAASAH